MITKNDCLSILVRLEDQGVAGIDAYMKQLLVSKDIPIDVLKFISKNQGIEVGKFYEMLRRNHNKKRSPLYLNIVREDKDLKEIITTLSCLLTQIILYSNKLTDSAQFLKEVRVDEITKALDHYFRDNNIEECTSLLNLIKTDILCLEYIAGRRELA